MTPSDADVLGRLDHIDDTLDDLLVAITGDQKLGLKGIAERLERVEGVEARVQVERAKVWDRIDKLERNWIFTVGLMVGSGILGGGAGAAIVNVLFGG